MTTGSSVAHPIRSRRRSWRRRIARLGFAVVVLGLVGLNAWWALRDEWPLIDLKAVPSLVAQKRYDEATTVLREHLRRSPHHGEARTMLARVLLLQGDKPGCLAELRQVPAWWPTKREALFIEGQVARQLHRARQAEVAWKACLADDPLHPTRPEYLRGAVNGLLEIYAAEERWDEARQVLWELDMQDDPAARPGLMGQWLDTQFLRIDPQESAPLLRRFVAADPDDWAARRALARVEQARQNFAEADRLIQSCLEARPEDRRAWRDRLWMLQERGDPAALVAEIGRVPPAANADPEVWVYRGIARRDARDLTGAADAFRRAVRWRPFDAEAHYRLAQVERLLGHVPAAQDHQKRSQALRALREQFPRAAQDYRDALTGAAKPGAPDVAASAVRLADLCQALGWPRAAQAWASIAALRRQASPVSR